MGSVNSAPLVPGEADPPALIRDAAQALLDRLDWVHADPAYASVWMISQIHVGPYAGPTYSLEMDALRLALSAPAVAALPQQQENRLRHAAKLLALELTDYCLELLRPEHGNTNVAVLKHWRDETMAALADIVDPAVLPLPEDDREFPIQWSCKAQASTDPPQDCDWPFCGCDPQAEKVIDAIEESGRYVPAKASAPPEDGRLRALISEMRTIGIVAGQCSVEAPDNPYAGMAAAEAERALRWADDLEAALPAVRPVQPQEEE